MTMKPLTLIGLYLVFFTHFAVAQNCSQGSSFWRMNGNTITAGFLNSGDMFWDLSESRFGVRANNSGSPFISTIFMGSIWLGGKDRSNNLRLSATGYRTGVNGNSFFPGPLQNGQTTTATCRSWDKHWVVSRQDINWHVAQVNAGRIRDTISNVFGWPGRNNPFFRQFNGFDLPPNQVLAPFFDKNRDGNYTPQFGDYPLPENIRPDAVPDEGRRLRSRTWSAAPCMVVRKPRRRVDGTRRCRTRPGELIAVQSGTPPQVGSRA